MNWPKYIILRVVAVMMPLLTAVAPAMAQDTLYAGYPAALSVVEVPGDIYVWELYNDVTSVDFVTDPGNCPPSEAYFTGTNTGPSVTVMPLIEGKFFYKVTAYRNNCTVNLKVGYIIVIWETPTATLATPEAICFGDSARLSATLTGAAPWSFTLTDGTNSWVYSNITSSPFGLTVPIIPTVTTSYWISSVTDAHVTNTIPSPPVLQVVNPLPVNSQIYQYGP